MARARPSKPQTLINWAPKRPPKTWLVLEARGEPIQGSRYSRDFCYFCGEPIRVTRVGGANLCHICGEDRKGPKCSQENLVEGGTWDNVVRTLEGD